MKHGCCCHEKRTYLRLVLKEEPTGQRNEVEEISKILSARNIDFTKEAEKHPKGGAAFYILWPNNQFEDLAKLLDEAGVMAVF